MSTEPIRTSKADKNFLSLNRDSVVWFAGTDGAHQGSIPYPPDLLPERPSDWDAIIKFSGRHNTELGQLRVAQGGENSVDVNAETHGLALEGEFGVGGGRGDQVITIKGGSTDILIKGIVYSDGVKADVTIGCWSDQSTKPSSHIDLSLLRHVSGRPLTVILGRVNWALVSIIRGYSPDIALPPGARIKRWASLGEWLYWWLKRAYVAIWYHR